MRMLGILWRHCMANLFAYSQVRRSSIVRQQQKQIKKVYEEALKEITKSVDKLYGKNDVSSSMRRVYLNKLKDDIKNQMDIVDGKTETIIKDNIGLMAEEVAKNTQMYNSKIGLNAIVNSTSLKHRVVTNIVTGKVYDSKFTLSSSIWGDNKRRLNEINRIIARDILQNKGVYDIAKDLERFVNPRARKDYDWSKMFPGSRRKIDYNAQRLARTMVSHAYQQAFVEATINNPFVAAYRWMTSGSDRVCPICIDRESTDQFGLGPGIFPKDRLPLDHPNGMCTFECVMAMSDEEVGEAIADWYLGEGDETMNNMIDRYVNDLKNF